MPDSNIVTLAECPISAHRLRVWRLHISWRRATDGLWVQDGKLVPWLCFVPWSESTWAFGSMKIGAWMIGATWEGDNISV